MCNKERVYVANDLDKFIRLKQAELIKKRGDNVTIKEVHEHIGKHCGLKGQTIALIKTGNYNPSLPVALKLADYFKVTVNEIFKLKDDLN